MESFDLRSEIIRALRDADRMTASDARKMPAPYRCLRHDDKTPSAWVGEQRHGCFACGIEGEPLDTLAAALGIEPQRRGFSIEDYADKKGFSIADLTRWGVHTEKDQFGADIVAIPYRDAAGRVLRRKFRPRNGKTFWEGKNLPIHPYGLDMLAKTDPNEPVILVEGESDCHAAWTHGVLAIGAPGAATWKADWARYLENREVYVWVEPDDGGATFAKKVAESVPHAKVIHAEGAKDLADLHQLEGARFKNAILARMARARTIGKPGAAPPNAPRLVLRKLAGVLTAVVRWFWRDRIAFGKLTIIEGHPGVGKGFVGMALAAAATKGRPLPGDTAREPMPVLLVGVEDALADTVKPRLDAAGADTELVFAFSMIEEANDTRRILSFPSDVHSLKRAIQDTGARLIIVDPITNHLDSGLNAYKDTDVRRALTPLAALAEDLGVAIVVVRHLVKASGGSAITAGSGSIAFVGVARCVMLCAKDPDEEEKRVLAVTKTNIGRLPPSLSFRIEEPPNERPRLVWAGNSIHTADDLIAAGRNDGERTKLAEATELLREWLAAGELPEDEIKGRAKDAQISMSTFYRAKEKIGAKSKRDGFGKGAHYFWYIPTTPDSVESMEKNGSQDNAGEQPTMLTKQNDEHGGSGAVVRLDYPCRGPCGRQLFSGPGRLCHDCRQRGAA